MAGERLWSADPMPTVRKKAHPCPRYGGRPQWWPRYGVTEPSPAMNQLPQHWTITESYTAPKGAHRNEDLLVSTPWGVAVIDGATDKSGLTHLLDGEQVASGYFAAHMLGRCLQQLPGSTLPTEAVQLCSAELDAAIRSQYPDIDTANRPSASLMVFNAEHDQLWWVGDCQAGYTAGEEVTVLDTGKHVDEVAGQFRAMVNAAADMAGDRVGDPGRDAIMVWLQRQGMFANSDHRRYGFGVCNGLDVPAHYVGIRAVSGTTDTIVLASDGYPKLADTDGLFDLARAEQYLAQMLADDPDCVAGLCSTKGVVLGANSFDDRTFVALTR